MPLRGALLGLVSFPEQTDSPFDTMNIVTALIFMLASRSHAFFLVVAVRSLLHALVVVAAKCHFQQHCTFDLLFTLAVLTPITSVGKKLLLEDELSDASCSGK